jgi:tetratricopeptide (TPR) repeat protein
MKWFTPRFALVCVLVPCGAMAQPAERGREFDRLVRQAATAYEAHDAQTAVHALERAYAIRPLPRLLFNLGRAHEQANNYTAAADYYRQFLATNPSTEESAVAREALGIAQRHIAEENANRQRESDAASQQRALEEARAHALDLERQREEEARRHAALTTRPRTITLPVGVAFGIAGAGVVAGGILGGLALSSQSSFGSDRSGQNRYDASATGTTMALGADIAFGTAVVAGVVGLVLYFTQSTSVSVVGTAQ